MDPHQFMDMPPEFTQPGTIPTAPISPGHAHCLTPEEFEALNKSVRLLRIHQLRYIVQKYQIPASGNKMKLQFLVLSIFQARRYDKVLIDILQEINKILAQQSDPCANPLASISTLDIVPLDPTFSSPPNPLYAQSDELIFGPILAPPGQSKGTFQFQHTSTGTSVNVCFLFPHGNPQQFGFQAELNGFPIEISIDDPFPQPLDVTHLLSGSGMQNMFDVRIVNCTAPMMICIREYMYNGLQFIADQIAGRRVDLDGESIYVVSRQCEQHSSFPLLPYLSLAFATGNWNCPVCRRPLDYHSFVVCQPTQAPEAVPQQTAMRSHVGDFFQLGAGTDPFSGAFEWDGF